MGIIVVAAAVPAKDINTAADLALGLEPSLEALQNIYCPLDFLLLELPVP